MNYNKLTMLWYVETPKKIKKKIQNKEKMD